MNHNRGAYSNTLVLNGSGQHPENLSMSAAAVVAPSSAVWMLAAIGNLVSLAWSPYRIGKYFNDFAPRLVNSPNDELQLKTFPAST
ncbi:hypothetical protein FOFC_01155 [Fusarium oxysporum]|nr:hypothetical protein FOFC_01155 [Fusarium oxysporum]